MMSSLSISKPKRSSMTVISSTTARNGRSAIRSETRTRNMSPSQGKRHARAARKRQSWGAVRDASQLIRETLRRRENGRSALVTEICRYRIVQLTPLTAAAVTCGCRSAVWSSGSLTCCRAPGRIPVKLSIQLRRRGFNGLTSGDPPAGWFCYVR